MKKLLSKILLGVVLVSFSAPVTAMAVQDSGTRSCDDSDGVFREGGSGRPLAGEAVVGEGQQVGQPTAGAAIVPVETD